MAQALPLFELPEAEAPPRRRVPPGISRKKRRRKTAAKQPALPGMPVVLRPPASPEPPVVSKDPEVFPGANAAREIAGLLERAYGRTGLDTARLFNRWLTCCHLALDRLPSFARQVMAGERPEDTPEQKEAWEKAVAGLPTEVIETFAQAFGILLNATTDEAGDLTYADVVGQVFEQAVAWPRGRSPLGQFFTPWTVAYAMALTVLGNGQAEDLLRQRFEEKCQDDPLVLARALVLLAIGDEDEPWAQRHRAALLAELEPITVLDPAVGSGVMLLAAASVVPRWMVDAGLVRFYGVDIDSTCVQMARLNVRLYGLNGTWVAVAGALRPEQVEQLPWPYGVLYSHALLELPPGREYWEQGVQYARAGRLGEWEGVGRLAQQ